MAHFTFLGAARTVTLPDPDSTILFVGYPTTGTRGRLLGDGAREVKIHDCLLPVTARVARLDSTSAHADRREILRWLATLPAGRHCRPQGARRDRGARGTRARTVRLDRSHPGPSRADRV